jgi:methanogenic corrinoid protein MtbC1
MDSKYVELEGAIHSGDIESGVANAIKLADQGISVAEIFSDCIEPSLAVVGERFSKLEIFLPEMINSAQVVKAVQTAMEPYMQGERAKTTRGKIVIGTAAGDLHDIGKNIVKSMLEVNNFEVKDLGVDVETASFINTAKEIDADIIAISALMLPSLPYVRDTIDLRNTDPNLGARIKIMVGGGPVSEEWAREAGADGYGDDAIEAVRVACKLLE